MHENRAKAAKKKNDNNYVVYTYYSYISGNEIYPLSLSKSGYMKNFLNFAFEEMEDTMTNTKDRIFRFLEIANKFRTNYFSVISYIQK